MDSDFEVDARLRPPKELIGPCPRSVKICSKDGRYALAVAIITIFGPLLLLGKYLVNDAEQIQQRSILSGYGRDVVGEVTGLAVGRGGVSSVKYVFSANGVKYLGEATTPSGDVVFKRSDKILVRFLPTNPTINHPSDWQWSAWMGLDKALFSLFFITIGCVAMRMLWRERKLAREGTVVTATVTHCIPQRNQFQTEYEFYVNGRKRVVGRSSSGEECEAGQSVWVLYLEGKPERNQMYPLSLYKVVG